MAADYRPRMDLARLHRTVALGLALVALGTGGVAAGPYQEGQDIEITGTVTDEAGKAVEGVTVVLEAARRAWRFGALNLEEKGRTIVDTASRKATTGPGGRFTIAWRWHDYYNHFELVAGRTVRDAGGERLVEIERIDLSRRIRQGSPVVTSIILPAASPPRQAGARPASPTPVQERVAERFDEAVRSEDEKRIVETHGRPDRVQVLDHTDYQEVTWWYFAAGKAYRFQDGELVQVIPFDPVEPF
jgi:hypothetical protein